MTVKNIYQYHTYSKEQLNELTTRHLTEILESARGRAICSCRKGHHCGDEVLDAGELEFNAKQSELFKNIKETLSIRPNLVSTKQVKKQEKKSLAY